MKRALSILFYCAAAVLASVPVFAQGTSAIKPGDPAPKFANPKALESGFVYGSEYIGSGWLLLSFFATDCEPCVRELPILERVLADYLKPGAKARLTGVLFDQDADRAVGTAFFKNRKSPFIVAQDMYNTTYRKYKGSGDSIELPLTILVAPDGTVAFVASGGSDATLAALKAFISAKVK